VDQPKVFGFELVKKSDKSSSWKRPRMLYNLEDKPQIFVGKGSQRWSTH